MPFIVERISLSEGRDPDGCQLLRTKTGAKESHPSTEVIFAGGDAWWPSQLPAVPDHGKTPVAIQLAPVNPGKTTLTIRGRNTDFLTNPDWKTRKFQITGRLGAHVVIQSDLADWGDGNPFGGRTDDFVATDLCFSVSMDFTFPFRAAGDWSWVITAEDDIHGLL